MRKIIARTTFMLVFYWLGLAAGLSATAENNDQLIRSEATHARMAVSLSNHIAK